MPFVLGAARHDLQSCVPSGLLASDGMKSGVARSNMSLEAAARCGDNESLVPLVTELHHEVTRAIEYLRPHQAYEPIRENVGRDAERLYKPGKAAGFAKCRGQH